jgi:hypothetical protein
MELRADLNKHNSELAQKQSEAVKLVKALFDEQMRVREEEARVKQQEREAHAEHVLRSRADGAKQALEMNKYRRDHRDPSVPINDHKQREVIKTTEFIENTRKKLQEKEDACQRLFEAKLNKNLEKTQQLFEKTKKFNEDRVEAQKQFEEETKRKAQLREMSKQAHLDELHAQNMKLLEQRSLSIGARMMQNADARQAILEKNMQDNINRVENDMRTSTLAIESLTKQRTELQQQKKELQQKRLEHARKYGEMKNKLLEDRYHAANEHLNAVFERIEQTRQQREAQREEIRAMKNAKLLETFAKKQAIMDDLTNKVLAKNLQSEEHAKVVLEKQTATRNEMIAEKKQEYQSKLEAANQIRLDKERRRQMEILKDFERAKELNQVKQVRKNAKNKLDILNKEHHESTKEMMATLRSLEHKLKQMDHQTNLMQRNQIHFQHDIEVLTKKQLDSRTLKAQRLEEFDKRIAILMEQKQHLESVSPLQQSPRNKPAVNGSSNGNDMITSNNNNYTNGDTNSHVNSNTEATDVDVAIAKVE